MTGSPIKQARQRFGQHRYPGRPLQGDPTRPAYTLYCLWKYPTDLAAANERDELLEQGPRNQARTLALLAVRDAFFEKGAVHGDGETVHAEGQENLHARMRNERPWKRRFEPGQAARHAQNFALAEAALIESQRRKQGPRPEKPPTQGHGERERNACYLRENTSFNDAPTPPYTARLCPLIPLNSIGTPFTAPKAPAK